MGHQGSGLFNKCNLYFIFTYSMPCFTAVDHSLIRHDFFNESYSLFFMLSSLIHRYRVGGVCSKLCPLPPPLCLCPLSHVICRKARENVTTFIFSFKKELVRDFS